MIDEEMSRVIRKLLGIAGDLNALIDSGKHEGVSKTEIITEINNHTIFKYLENNFQSEFRWALGNLSDDDKWHLIGEWQSMANAIDSERKLGISNSGICLLIGYVLEGIQMRTFSKTIWPGPDPW